VGYTAVHPEVTRVAVVELLGVDVDAVDPENKLAGQRRGSIRIALAGRWRWQGLAIDCAAQADTPTLEAWLAPVCAARADALPVAGEPAAPSVDGTNEAFPLAPTGHALWLGRQNELHLGGIGNCSAWVTGELRVGGRGIARGYRGSPNPTADRFGRGRRASLVPNRSSRWGRCNEVCRRLPGLPVRTRSTAWSPPAWWRRIPPLASAPAGVTTVMARWSSLQSRMRN
jgi:aryl carrier-like protein